MAPVANVQIYKQMRPSYMPMTTVNKDLHMDMHEHSRGVFSVSSGRTGSRNIFSAQRREAAH